METNAAHEMPYAINGYRNGRGKKFHIQAGVGRRGASGFMNEISFPEKTPPIRGLREANRFIPRTNSEPNDSSVACFVTGLESRLSWLRY